MSGSVVMYIVIIRNILINSSIHCFWIQDHMGEWVYVNLLNQTFCRYIYRKQRVLQNELMWARDLSSDLSWKKTLLAFCLLFPSHAAPVLSVDQAYCLLLLWVINTILFHFFYNSPARANLGSYAGKYHLLLMLVSSTFVGHMQA